MATLADNLWFARNQCQYNAKPHSVVAAILQDVDELEEAVAMLNMQPKRTQPKKKGGKSEELCHNYKKYRDQAWKSANTSRCTWLGNE